MRKLLGVLAVFFAGSYLSAATADDYAAVKSVVQKYFDGTEKGMVQLLPEAFLPTAEIQYVKEDGTLGRIAFADYAKLFTPGQRNERSGRLASMDITGNAAVAKVEIFMASRGRVYTDYILLLRVDDAWRISNKIATFREKY